MNCIFSNEDCNGDLKYRMPLAAVERSAVLCEYHWTLRKDDVRLAKSTGCTCWEGYERVPGTKPCASGSCRKKKASHGDVGQHLIELGIGLIPPAAIALEINKDKIKDTWQGVVDRAKGVKDFLTDKVDGVAKAIERKVDDPNGAISQMDEGMTSFEDAIAGGAKRVVDTLKGIRRGSRNDELVESLKDVLGNAFSMYIRTHGAHWNVIGKDFSQYHGLFEEIYEDVYDSIDPLAENIRKLEGEAPGSLSEFDELDGLKDATPSETSEQSLAQDVLNANRIVLESLDKAFEVADKANEQGIANFLAERIDMHQKWQWQLTSSIGENNE